MLKDVAILLISLIESGLAHSFHLMVMFIHSFSSSYFTLYNLSFIADETIISEDPTPAETSNQKNKKMFQQVNTFNVYILLKNKITNYNSIATK